MPLVRTPEALDLVAAEGRPSQRSAALAFAVAREKRYAGELGRYYVGGRLACFLTEAERVVVEPFEKAKAVEVPTVYVLSPEADPTRSAAA